MNYSYINSINESYKHCVERKKPDIKEDIPCDTI